MENKDVFIEKIRDPKFYLENFTKIKARDGLVPFKLKACQLKLFNELKRHDRVIILKSRQLGMCLHEDTRILTANLEWKKIKEINVGDEIVAYDENTPGNNKQRKMRTAIVEDKFVFKKDTLKITLDDGRTLIGTPEHRMLSKKWKTGTELAWKRFENFKVGDSIRHLTTPWDEDRSFEDGWFGGMLDGEGSIANKNRSGGHINVSQVDGPVWDRCLAYANSRNIPFKIEVDRRKAGDSSKLGDKPVNKLCINRMNEIFRVIGITRPSRFLGKRFWEGRALPNDGWAKIVSIEHAGEKNVVDLQTSCKTYIAEGFVSHNSTAVVGYLYHKALTTPAVNIAIIGYNADLTRELLDKVKTFMRTTPEKMRPTIAYDSKTEVSFPAMDSKIIVLPSTTNVGRGYSLNFVLATELSMWDDADEKMATLEASVSMVKGQIIIESTPGDIGNKYHQIWSNDDNSYKKMRFGYEWGYTKEELDIIEKNINDPKRFAREYLLEFTATGRPVFDINILNKMRKHVLRVGDVRKLENGEEFTVYEENGVVVYGKPRAGGTYVLGADVSEGVDGGDYSVMTILDRVSGEEVAQYRGHIPADVFGGMINSWGRKYNNALAVVECNNHGLTTLTTLKNLMYPSMYFRPAKYDAYGGTFSDRIGWRTTTTTRPLMIDELGKIMREGELIIHSKKTLDEMTTFVYNNNGKAEPSTKAFHDDTIFAIGVAIQGFKNVSNKPLDQLNCEQYLPNNFSY